MNELFLINCKTKDGGWKCERSTHSLEAATEYAKAFRQLGCWVKVKSILILENGKVKV